MTIKGRYPGTNWNSQKVVKNEILNNRGVSGSSVYNKEPLYTFVLNATTIKAIRNYNKNKNYADFNLKCKKNGTTACVSSFVHSNSYGLTDGTCFSVANSGNDFYTCAEQ